MARQSGSSGHKWTQEQREKFKATMAARRVAKPTKSASRRPMFAQLVLAKKLRRMILNRIAVESDIGEVELTALLLVNELLGHRDR